MVVRTPSFQPNISWGNIIYIMCASWIKCLLPESRHIEIHVQFILQIYNRQNKNRNTLLPSKYQWGQQNVMYVCMMYGLVSTIRVTQLHILVFMLWLCWVTILYHTILPFRLKGCHQSQTWTSPFTSPLYFIKDIQRLPNFLQLPFIIMRRGLQHSSMVMVTPHQTHIAHD